VTHRRRRSLAGRAVWLPVAAAIAVLAAGTVAFALVHRAPASSGGKSPTSFGSGSGSGSPGPQHGSQSPQPGGGKPTGASSGGDPGSVAAGHDQAARLVPSAGAYLGAYVAPVGYTPDAQIAAVQSFQRSIGAQIDLVHTYHPWDDPFPDAADRYFLGAGKVLLLTWGGTADTRSIVAGRYDALIRARAIAIKRLGRPILLEYRHEMDRPNLQWAVHGPKNFIAAWDHIRAIFNQVGAHNVGWVWCPTGWGFQHGRSQTFYPGNDEVDWVCADVYSVSTAEPLQESAHYFLSWARHTGKPVLIGEFATDGGPAALSRWLFAAGALAELDPQIKGMAYFDANGTDSQGRPFRYWLGDDPTALRAFGQMLGWPTFRPDRASSQ